MNSTCADCGADLGLITFVAPLFCDDCFDAPVRRTISPPSTEAKSLKEHARVGDLLPDPILLERADIFYHPSSPLQLPKKEDQTPPDAPIEDPSVPPFPANALKHSR